LFSQLVSDSQTVTNGLREQPESWQSVKPFPSSSTPLGAGDVVELERAAKLQHHEAVAVTAVEASVVVVVDEVAAPLGRVLGLARRHERHAAVAESLADAVRVAAVDEAISVVVEAVAAALVGPLVASGRALRHGHEARAEAERTEGQRSDRAARGSRPA
jgi:hypothetical protein